MTRIAYGIFIILVSCDIVIGEEGVVQNKLTGRRLANTKVVLESSHGNFETVTDPNGYFNLTKIIGCGIGNCDSEYQLNFTQQGYESTQIDENFFKSQAAIFVTDGRRDTLIIELPPF